MADSCAAAGRIPTHVLPLDKSVVGNGHVEIRDVALSHLKSNHLCVECLQEVLKRKLNKLS